MKKLESNVQIRECFPSKQLKKMAKFFPHDKPKILRNVEDLTKFILKLKLIPVLFNWVHCDKFAGVISELNSFQDRVERAIFVNVEDFFDQKKGEIRKEALKNNEMIAHELAEMFFPILDIDKDGTIQFLELVENFAIFAHGPTDISDIKFKLYDRECTGNLSRQQLASGISRDVRLMILFQTLWTKVAIKKTLLPDEKIKHSIEQSVIRMSEVFSDPNLTEKSVEIYFQIVDWNHSDNFNREDYLAFHKNHDEQKNISKLWKQAIADQIPDEILRPANATTPRRKSSLHASNELKISNELKSSNNNEN